LTLFRLRLILLVLYSTRLGSKGWKLGDFSQVASLAPQHPGMYVYADRLHWSTGYTAPEIVERAEDDMSARYNTKVDIWGMGCILYMLLHRKRPFKTDWEVSQYAGDSKSVMLSLGPCLDSAVSKSKQDNTYKVVSQMFAVDPVKRPTAEQLKDVFTIFVNA
jgi:serine/threonine protein kinase